MRLNILDNGHHWKQKIPMAFIKLMMGRVPGPLLLFSYRKKFFGDHFCLAVQEAMRDSTLWQKAELELFAAFVSHLNQCEY